MPIRTAPVRQIRTAIPTLERNVPGEMRSTFAAWGPKR